MKQIAVIGLGRFGSAVAIRLFELGNEVLAIDVSDSRIDAISDRVTQAVICDARDTDSLREVGVADCDCAIVAIASDIAASVLITMTLKEIGVPQVICKACTPVHQRVLEKVGADKVLFPEQEMAYKLAQNISSSRVLDFIELSADYGIAEITCPKAWRGKTLMENNIRKVYGVNVLAVREHGHTILVSPTPDYCFSQDDIVVVLGSNTQLNSVQAI